MRVLVVDNYDSFTFNLVQAFLTAEADVTVRTNDGVTPDEAEELAPTHLVVSPGPGRPEAAGASMAVIERFAGRIPVLGVCLGHQAVAAVFGGRVGAARTIMHGKASEIHHDGRTIYAGLPDPFPAGRYHSLAVAEVDLPAELTVSAHTADGEIMGIRHRSLPVEGVQFHPESVLTPLGDRLLRSFLDLAPQTLKMAQRTVVT
jgi:anthranilate synthase/aminodeoxychorismate synthase-like glutamine amidotransferase